ncbi:hypothetical protein CVT25_006511 [Psilocybe cyanescens]|uniref:Mid2 domain-containing protein n=1 Tax=Psilocybe cyanescens TaxID=93625 RepID=A0A409XEB8_PSICY|nr:hypothetical protein CVT25_006511 [Psilocybe cyanescens]
MLWLLLSLFTLFALFHSSSAQSDASCLPFYNWTFNSHEQTPCDVASSLLAANDNFDQSLARQDANLTESMAIPSPTSTIGKSTSTQKTSSAVTKSSTTPPTSVSTASPTASAVDTSTVNSAKIKRDNAMGGGIVGGLAALFLLCGALYWYLQNRRKRIARNGQHLPSSPTDPENASWHAGQGPYMTQLRGNETQARSIAPSNSSLPPAPIMHDVESSIAGSADSVQVIHAR